MALDKVKIGVLDGASTGVKSDRHTIPSVTTSERDAGSFSAAVGDIIYNSTIGNLQQYTATGWASVAAPPAITGVTYPTESGAVLTALDATGSSDAAQTLIINGSNFTSTVTVEIQISGSFVAFASSTSVNGGRTQVTCTGVTKRAAADGYTLRVTNSTGLDASTTVNFSADPSFSTAADLGTAYAGLTLNKSIAFTGTKVIQGATAKPTWMTVTGNTSTAEDGDGQTAFDATGSPVTLGGTIASPASGNSQTHTFSIIVRDAENQTFNRDFSLTALTAPTGGDNIYTYQHGGSGTTYRVHLFTTTGTTPAFVCYGNITGADILIVGGGGAGGNGLGGGGAGGVVQWATNYTITSGSHNIVVGAGASAQTGSNNSGGSGSASTFHDGSQDIKALGGGGGAGENQYVPAPSGNPATNHSNTGGTSYNNAPNDGRVPVVGPTYTGWTAYHNKRGGHPSSANMTGLPSGGGAGAGADGGDASSNQGGAGGNGIQIAWATPRALKNTTSTVNGTTVDAGFYWAGGGGGSVHVSGTSGTGTHGGGGGSANAGGTTATNSSNSYAFTTGASGATAADHAAGGAGGANTGAGGGGGTDGSGDGGAGGSGIVVIRYPI